MILAQSMGTLASPPLILDSVPKRKKAFDHPPRKPASTSKARINLLDI